MEANRRSLPTAETRLFRILNDPDFKHRFYANLKKSNPLIVPLYQMGLLPLLGVSRTIMLLTTKGNKSGKLRVTPIGYFRIGGVIHLFSAWGKGASWYKNLISHPDQVWIQIGLRKQPVQAQALSDPTEIRNTLEQFITESPGPAHYLFGWEPESDRIGNTDFSTLMDQVLIVRFTSRTGKKDFLLDR